jgi:predicted O-methyltransferase YrrM
MTNIYRDISWKDQKSALDAVDDLLVSVTGRRSPPSRSSFEVRFDQLQRFDVDQTGFSPLMLYFLYQLGVQSHARRVLGCGVYAGIALSILAAGVSDGNPDMVSAIGVDEEPNYVYLSQRNSIHLNLQDRLTYKVGAPLEFIRAYDQPIDLLMIDVHHPEREKEDYGPIMSSAVSKLPRGAAVIAHDALIPRWQHNVRELERILAMAGDFNGPWTLPIDATGIVLAIRK